MKIEYITSVYLNEPSAPAHHVLSCCETFGAMGHSVSLGHPGPALPASASDGLFQSTPVLYPRVRGGWRLFEHAMARYVRQRVKTSRPDVLYFRCTPSDVLRQTLEQCDTLKVLECNGDGFATPIGRRFANAFDLVLVDSEEMRTLVGAQAPELAHKVDVHPHPATDTRRFRAMEQALCRQQLGLPENEKMLLHVSGFQPYHDFETLRRVLGRLKAGGHPCRLLLLGDGPARRAVEAAFAGEVAAGQAAFVGPVGLDKLPAYLGASDVCLDLLKAEKLRQGNLRAYKLYEYAAAQRPIVESVDFSLPVAEWAKETMWLVPPESPAAVASAVGEILAAHADVARRTEAGRAYVERYRSWDVAATETLRILQERLTPSTRELAKV